MILAEIEPNVIIVFVAVIIAGIKALLEKRAAEKNPPTEEDTSTEYEDLYEAYEAELEAQRQQLQISTQINPPPLPTPAPAPVYTPDPTPAPLPKVIAPTLSRAEEEALKRLESDSGPSRRKTNNLSTKARLKAHLASPTAAREALLLAEVLGPPKAFK